MVNRIDRQKAYTLMEISGKISLCGWPAGNTKVELACREKSGDYICSSYFELGFLLGRTGFLSQGIPAFILMKKEFSFFRSG